MTSAFDPDLFLSTSVSGALDTRYMPVPQGEYAAIIEEVKARIQPGQGDNAGKEFLIFDVLWLIDDQKVRDATGRDKVTVRQSLFIDRTPDGSIDISKGKNIQLGKLREALGQNTPGAWAPSMLKGQVARVKIGHKPDTKNPGDVFDNVTAVTKL